jgi:hypothetical protein
MIVFGYTHFGGRHGESAALKNLLAFTRVTRPDTGQPFSEALCFGIAGGIGAGYSFCPSVPRHGTGSGVSVVGRHKSYATDAGWYQGFCDRLGITTRITETSGPAKAYQNLIAELKAGRPTVVWCARGLLPFMGEPMDSCNLWMHSFIVCGVDEGRGIALGADRAPTPVSLTLDQLAAARGGICSHKNRTLTIDPPQALTAASLREAVVAGLRACAGELLEGKMKTFSLPGLEIWAKMITNDTNKDGWPKVFADGLLYCALRDVFDSIETAGTGGGLYRELYADFLDEASVILRNDALADLAYTYRNLATAWTELAEAALPETAPAIAETRDLLREKRRLFEEVGAGATQASTTIAGRLRMLEGKLRADLPLGPDDRAAILSDLRRRIVDLHGAESRAANSLQSLAASFA